jgi:hypothetical protein
MQYIREKESREPVICRLFSRSFGGCVIAEWRHVFTAVYSTKTVSFQLERRASVAYNDQIVPRSSLTCQDYYK